MKLSNSQITIIHDWYLEKKTSISALQRATGINRTTIATYCKRFDQVKSEFPKRKKFRLTDYREKKREKPPTPNYMALQSMFLPLLANSEVRKNTPRAMFTVYQAQHPGGYTFNGFKRIYMQWRVKNNICLYAHRGIKSIAMKDKTVLTQWRKGNDLEKWRKAIVIQGSFDGVPLKDLQAKVEIGMHTLTKWIANFREKGTAGLIKKPMSIEPWVKQKAEKRDNLMKLIHETPNLHGFNRTTWRIEDLSATYLKIYGHQMAVTTMRVCLKANGFKFRKAREVLTSPDPDFRVKLDNIKHILSRLKPDERFFSMDEMGPIAIKMKPGWSHTLEKDLKLIPQIQKSKGWFILTAAIELSANQVTHFYSYAKNSREMIKLVDVLCHQYKDMKKLYISGDAVSWHKSAELQAHLDEINQLAESGTAPTPSVEMALLPASAQFLNVIESIFSGLAKSIIHNSDYQSVAECKAAIDRYFSERNDYFRKNPKRAGNKIWGREMVKPVFDEAHNCKDPKMSR